MFFEIIGLLVVFAIILLLCYYTTRFVGKKFSGGTRTKSMKILETLPLGLDRSLYLILVGKKTFLFFSSKKGLELVSEIEIEELTEEAAQEKNESTNIFDFSKIFENYSGLSRKTSLNNSEEQGRESEDSRSSDFDGSSHVVRADRSQSILGSIKRLQKINGSKK